MHDKILILDFGSQVTQLIARRVREMQVFCEIHPYDDAEATLKAWLDEKSLRGIILSGGPNSVYAGGLWVRTSLDMAMQRAARDALRAAGLSDKGVGQLTHPGSDFASYNRLNLAVATDYDYRDLWRTLAFDWQHDGTEPPGDNTRGVRPSA